VSESTPKLTRETWLTLRLAVPLVIGQVGQMLIALSDTLMLGWLGVVPLAACSFASNLIYVPMMVGVGMSLAVSVRVSNARGANDPASARAALRHGFYLTLALGALTLAGTAALIPYLGIFRQDPEVIEAVPVYLLLVAASMVPAMATMAWKNHADAMNRPWPAFWISMGGVVLNIVLNWGLIFGNLGMPAMGLEGAGVATLIARTAAFLGLVIWSGRDVAMREWVPHRWWCVPDWKSVRGLLATGFPASMQLLAEVSAFAAATIIIGMLGAAALASHQVALQCAATVFMIPLGISLALTVRMGEAAGSGNHAAMRSIVIGGWVMGLTVNLCSASAFVFANWQIAGWFIQEPEVRNMAASLLLVAAAFQLCDGFQVISVGGLRGLDDVRVPAWMMFGAFWIFGIPFGSWLAFGAGMGAEGVWWGLVTGLTLNAIMLGHRVWRKSRPCRS
jgi:MATE family multidrug resistance protein